jgi:peptidoglycan/xylan/chitin deacetylase (PgdA/CDA1 family)
LNLKLLFAVTILLSTLFNISNSNATEPSDTDDKKESTSKFPYSCQCVSFRLDDVQDYFLVQAQMEIIKTFEKKNASLTIGIIGNLIGNDTVLVNFLREKIAEGGNDENDSNSFVLEVANHGWKHEDFTFLNEEEQSILMQKTNEKIVDILGVKPRVFIPPFNRLNNDTMTALGQNQMRYISANTTFYAPSFLNDLESRSFDQNNSMTGTTSGSDLIFHYPSLATTGDINADYTEWFGNSHDDVFTDVNASMHRLGYAVVTLHPQEHSIRNGFEYEGSFDSEQIHELELLIDDIRAAGFRIVTISQISEDNSTSIPEFSSYSLHAILIISIVLVTWFSIRGHGTISRRFL